MKIGLVFDDSLDKTDGVAQYVLTLGEWLQSQGHEVHYLVGETERTDMPNLHSLSRNVNVRFNQNRIRTPLPARKQEIRELLGREQFDVLHVQVPYSPWLAGRIIKAAGSNTAVVGTFHIAPSSWMVNAGTKALGLWLRRSLRRFNAFVSVSSVARDFARRTFGIRSIIIPNTAPLERFFNAQPFAEFKKERTVMFLGRLVERKGCQFLLSAVAKLQREGNWPANARVLVCGEGPLKLRLTQFVHEAGLTELVQFKGFISEKDKPRYLASADVAIFPATGGESFGIVLIEAMAAARGVVLAGNNPGYALVMQKHSENLFDPRNTDALAELLLASLSDDASRKTAGKWQREYARQFAPAVVGKKILGVYMQALREVQK